MNETQTQAKTYQTIFLLNYAFGNGHCCFCCISLWFSLSSNGGSLIFLCYLLFLLIEDRQNIKEKHSIEFYNRYPCPIEREERTILQNQSI